MLLRRGLDLDRGQETFKQSKRVNRNGRSFGVPMCHVSVMPTPASLGKQLMGWQWKHCPRCRRPWPRCAEGLPVLPGCWRRRGHCNDWVVRRPRSAYPSSCFADLLAFSSFASVLTVTVKIPERLGMSQRPPFCVTPSLSLKTPMSEPLRTQTSSETKRPEDADGGFVGAPSSGLSRGPRAPTSLRETHTNSATILVQFTQLSQKLRLCDSPNIFRASPSCPILLGAAGV